MSEVNRPYSFIRIAVISTILLLGGCPAIDMCPSNPGSEDAGFGVIGDSINAGAGCMNCLLWNRFEEGFLFPVSYGGWPIQLADMNDMPIANWAVGGATVLGDGVFNIPGQLASLLSARPSVHTVFIDGGINDLIYAEQANRLDSSLVNEVIDGITGLYQDAYDSGLNAIVLTIPYLNDREPSVSEEGKGRINDAVDELNEIIKEASNEFGFNVYDLHDLMVANPSYYKDHIHLTCAGYEQVADDLTAIFFVLQR